MQRWGDWHGLTAVVGCAARDVPQERGALPLDREVIMQNVPAPPRPSGPKHERGRGSPQRLFLRGSIRLLVCSLVVWIAPLHTADATGFDINTADAAVLAAELPGIGPVKAARIVAHRDAHGPFADLGSLIAVPGIGPKTLDGIRRHLGDPPSSGDALAAPGGGRMPSERDEQGISSGEKPPRSSSELEAEARIAVRRLMELARADGARRGDASRRRRSAVPAQ